MNAQQNHFQFQDEQIAPQVDIQPVNAMNAGVTDQQIAPELQRQPIDDSLYRQARSSFIFKVYIILAMELLVNAVFVTLTMAYAPVMQFMTNPFLTMLAFLIGTAVYIALVCKRELCQQYPKNMMMLAVFTLCTSFWVSAVCARYKVQSVAIAAGATAASAIGITLYTKFSKSEFSTLKQLAGAVGSSLVSTALFVSLASFFFPLPAFMGFITLLLSLLCPIYLVYDTKMILDQTKHQLTLDQYVLASLLLYIDIVGVFMDILRLIGSRR